MGYQVSSTLTSQFVTLSEWLLKKKNLSAVKKLTTFALILLTHSACIRSRCQTSFYKVNPDGPHKIRLYYLNAPTTKTLEEVDALEGEREIHSAVSPDGKHFFFEGVRFAAEGISGPDIFPSTVSEYVLFTTSGQSLIKATSNRLDGDFSESSGFQSPLISKSSTLRLPDGTVRTFSSGVGGIVSHLYSPITGGLTSEGTALVHSHDSGIFSDPAVTALSNGTYFMVYKYHSAQSVPGIEGDELYGATSEDGATFTSSDVLLRSAASSAGVAALGDILYMYFIDGTSSLSTTGGLAHGVSYDLGGTFHYDEVCLGEWQISGAFDPAAIGVQ